MDAVLLSAGDAAGGTADVLACVALAAIAGIGGTEPLPLSAVPSASRRRFTPRDELSFKPRAVALIRI